MPLFRNPPVSRSISPSAIFTTMPLHVTSNGPKRRAFLTSVPRNTIFRLDHTSIVLPSRDVSCLRNSVEPTEVLEARRLEVDVISDFGLVDSFVCLHQGRLDDLLGRLDVGLLQKKTGELPRQPRAGNMHSHEQDLSDVDLDRKRRIDRILDPENFQCHIQECYTTFLGSSDHKAIFLNLAPPEKGTHEGKGAPPVF